MAGKAAEAETSSRVESPPEQWPLALYGLLRDGTRWCVVEVPMTAVEWRALRRRAVVGERLSLGFAAGALESMGNKMLEAAKEADDPRVGRRR